jgi:methyl-accepting chemotaxis protein
MSESKVATAIADGEAPQVAAKLIAKVGADLGDRTPALVMVFASTKQPLAELMPLIAAAFPRSTVLGASTAGEFIESGDAKSSVAIFALAGDYRIFAGLSTGLKASAEQAVQNALEGMPTQLVAYPHRTAILLIDPLSGSSEEATLMTAGFMGFDLRLAGGAAGDDLALKCTYVSLGSQVITDGVVIATLFSKQPLGVGVCHGHEPLSVPLTITRAEGSIVHEIDGRPAWEVWVERTREATTKLGFDPAQMPAGDVGGYLLRFEAALSQGEALKIRAPLFRVGEHSIGFACGIPEGSVIRITESVPSRQVDSAREAARRALAQVGGVPLAGAVVFDCICRNLILKDEFKTAIAGIHEELGQVPLAGFETYGEIALDAGDLSGFHNTTTVVLAFPK